MSAAALPGAQFVCRRVSGQPETTAGNPGHAVEPIQITGRLKGSNVSFVLVYGDHELALPLRFEAHVEETLVRLMEAAAGAATGDRTRIELASRLVDAVTAMLETNVLPPSERQVKYAVAVARELNLQIPAAVLQHRSAMAEFLANHAETYRRSRAR